MCKETIKSSSQGVEKNTNSSYATDLDLHSGKNLQKKKHEYFKSLCFNWLNNLSRC